MTDQQIHDSISADATAKSLADAGNDAGCAARLEVILPPIPSPVTSSLLLVWGASRAVLSGILAGTSNSSPAISSACQAVQLALSGGAASLDITNPIIAGTGGLLDGLTAAGILPANTATAPAVTPGSKADLIAYGSAPQTVAPSDVSRVWSQYRPGGRIGTSP